MMSVFIFRQMQSAIHRTQFKPCTFILCDVFGLFAATVKHHMFDEKCDS